MKKVRTAALFAGGALIGAAVATELAKPESERTWHGSIEGVVPYDLRPPTIDRLRETYWNTESDEILVPNAFGVGWSINFAGLVNRIRDYSSSRDVSR